MKHAILAPSILALSLLAALAGGCTHPHVRTAQAFESAKDRGDLDAARALMGQDPRLWFEAREGPGSAWTLEGGIWSTWDDHFRGTRERLTAWRIEGDRVWADMRETNDYYRLTERGSGFWRRSYFFGTTGPDAGRIVGTMIGPTMTPASDRPASDPGRFDEFEAWAKTHHPDELGYLMPGGRIDPTGDRAPRFRALLNSWRESIGLPRID